MCKQFNSVVLPYLRYWGGGMPVWMDILFWGGFNQQKIFSSSCDFAALCVQSSVISPYMVSWAGVAPSQGRTQNLWPRNVKLLLMSLKDPLENLLLIFVFLAFISFIFFILGFYVNLKLQLKLIYSLISLKYGVLISVVAPIWQRTTEYILLKLLHLPEVQPLFKFHTYFMPPCIHQTFRCYTWWWKWQVKFCIFCIYFNTYNGLVVVTTVVVTTALVGVRCARL